MHILSRSHSYAVRNSQRIVYVCRESHHLHYSSHLMLFTFCLLFIHCFCVGFRPYLNAYRLRSQTQSHLHISLLIQTPNDASYYFSNLFESTVS